MATGTEFEYAACSKYEAVLEDYLEGALSVADARNAENHWRDCAACRDALEQATGTPRAIASSTGRPKPS